MNVMDVTKELLALISASGTNDKGTLLKLGLNYS